jgi:hypothetical protein
MNKIKIFINTYKNEDLLKNNIDSLLKEIDFLIDKKNNILYQLKEKQEELKNDIKIKKKYCCFL